jgi:hypothetical protein
LFLLNQRLKFRSVGGLLAVFLDQDGKIGILELLKGMVVGVPVADALAGALERWSVGARHR